MDPDNGTMSTAVLVVIVVAITLPVVVAVVLLIRSFIRGRKLPPPGELPLAKSAEPSLKEIVIARQHSTKKVKSGSSSSSGGMFVQYTQAVPKPLPPVAIV